MPRKVMTWAECAQLDDRVLAAIVDAHRAERYPSAALIASLVGCCTTAAKAHIARLRDAKLLRAVYSVRGSLVVSDAALVRRDTVLADIPIFAMPRKRHIPRAAYRAGGCTTRAIHGVEHYRQMGRIGGSRFWRNNPTAQARLVRARVMAMRKRQKEGV